MTMQLVVERCSRCGGKVELREDHRHRVFFLSCIACSCRRYFEEIERFPEVVNWPAWWRVQKSDRFERELLKGRR
jgi:hypothetical protein